MRPDEETCRQAFDSFLKSRYEGNDIIWTDGDEPPDYYLMLSGTRYAVEVTSIREKATLGDNTTDHLQIDKSVERLIEDIQNDAIAEGILNGAYIVRYKPLRDLSKQKSVISRRIRDYLRANQYVMSAPAQDIVGKGHLRWYIWKVHSERSCLTRVTGNAKWEGEAANELCNLLGESLNNKAKKLAAVSLPKIILLHDRFAWIDAAQWNQCLTKLSCVNSFHTIFVVSEKSNNYILSRIESSWSP